MKIKADEIKGMKLQDFLAMLPPHTNIAIGSKTSFVYIGRVDGFARDADAIYTDYRDRAERSIGKKSFINPKDREWAFRYLTESVPFMERRIVRIYPRRNPLEPFIINCIIDGEEIGKYWFLDEYRRQEVDEP